MRSIWHCPFFLIPVLLFLIFSLVFTLLKPYGYELVVLNEFRTEPLNTFFKGCTLIGEFPLWLIIAVLLAFDRLRYGVLILVAGGIIAPLAATIKHFAGVPRPNTFLDRYNYQDLVVKVPDVQLLGGYNSMPSGHTTIAFAMLSLVTLMLYKKNPWFGLLAAWTAILAGISRVFLVQHFLTDVIAGSLLGLLIGDLVWQIHLRTAQN